MVLFNREDGGVLSRPLDAGWRRTSCTAHLPSLQIRFRVRVRAVPEPGPDQDPLVRQHGQRVGLPGGEVHRAPGHRQRHPAGHRPQIRGHGESPPPQTCMLGLTRTGGWKTSVAIKRGLPTVLSDASVYGEVAVETRRGSKSCDEKIKVAPSF